MKPGRNRRDLEVLCHVADAMASKNIERAADLVTQRMVAVKMASGGWTCDKARYVELLPPDSTNIVNWTMQAVANKVAARAKKEGGSSSEVAWKPRGQRPWLGNTATGGSREKMGRATKMQKARAGSPRRRGGTTSNRLGSGLQVSEFNAARAKVWEQWANRMTSSSE